MSVVRVDVLCCCEGCGKQFGIELDTCTDQNSSDFEYLAREAILGGANITYTWGVKGKKTVERFPLSYQTTIQGGYMLCDVCSEKCDQLAGTTDEELTKAEVDKCLNIVSM